MDKYIKSKENIERERKVGNFIFCISFHSLCQMKSNMIRVVEIAEEEDQVDSVLPRDKPAALRWPYHNFIEAFSEGALIIQLILLFLIEGITLDVAVPHNSNILFDFVSLVELLGEEVYCVAHLSYMRPQYGPILLRFCLLLFRCLNGLIWFFGGCCVQIICYWV